MSEDNHQEMDAIVRDFFFPKKQNAKLKKRCEIIQQDFNSFYHFVMELKAKKESTYQYDADTGGESWEEFGICGY